MYIYIYISIYIHTYIYMYSSSSSVSVPSTNKTVALKGLIHVFTYIHRAKTKIPAAPRRSRPGKNASASTRGCMNTPAKMKNKNENAGARVSVVCEKASRPESRPPYALCTPLGCPLRADPTHSLHALSAPLRRPYAPFTRVHNSPPAGLVWPEAAPGATLCVQVYIYVCVCVCVCVCMYIYRYTYRYIYI